MSTSKTKGDVKMVIIFTERHRKWTDLTLYHHVAYENKASLIVVITRMHPYNINSSGR